MRSQSNVVSKEKKKYLAKRISTNTLSHQRKKGNNPQPMAQYHSSISKELDKVIDTLLLYESNICNISLIFNLQLLATWLTKSQLVQIVI